MPSDPRGNIYLSPNFVQNSRSDRKFNVLESALESGQELDALSFDLWDILYMSSQNGLGCLVAAAGANLPLPGETDVQRDPIETPARPTSPNENLTHESRERQ